MPSPTTRGYPYPSGSDSAAGPAAFQALAEAVNDDVQDVEDALTAAESALDARLDAVEPKLPYTLVGTYSGAWNPANSGGFTVSTTVAVAGAAVGDLVVASLSTLPTKYFLTAHVSATNTVSVQIVDPEDTSGVDPASGTLKVLVLRPTF